MAHFYVGLWTILIIFNTKTLHHSLEHVSTPAITTLLLVALHCMENWWLYLVKIVRGVTVWIISVCRARCRCWKFLPLSSEPCPSSSTVTMELDGDTAASTAGYGFWYSVSTELLTVWPVGHLYIVIVTAALFRVFKCVVIILLLTSFLLQIKTHKCELNVASVLWCQCPILQFNILSAIQESSDYCM